MTAHAALTERVRGLRRDLVAARHREDEAVAANDPAVRTAEKAAARDTYQLARASADSDAELREATAVWAKAVDYVNRAAARRRREAAKARTELTTLEAALHRTEREEQAARLHADQLEAACLDARVRLAACEEQGRRRTPRPGPRSSSRTPPRGATRWPSPGPECGPPLVIESIVSGDPVALELAAAGIAEHTGASPATIQLQLQELLDAVLSAAAEDGYLVFDSGHPFWAGLSFEEARDVINALARLGFIFEPTEGWHAGRAPAPTDLSMALAYAGLDPRNMRDLPNADDLLALPGSIGVDARGFLAAHAPELTVDNVVLALGRRAAQLEPLWNEWGQVRPMLLSDRHSLGSVPG